MHGTDGERIIEPVIIAEYPEKRTSFDQATGQDIPASLRYENIEL